MTDWREHNGGPQPVADDVWVDVGLRDGRYISGVMAGAVRPVSKAWPVDIVRYRILNQHLIDAKQVEIDALQHEVMWLHNALEQTEEAVVYGYTLLDDMDAKIDAARLEGIRLGLEAAEKYNRRAFDLIVDALRNTNPDTIAQEADNEPR